jgi:DNA-binding transcriptional LysR family regulator
MMGANTAGSSNVQARATCDGVLPISPATDFTTSAIARPRSVSEPLESGRLTRLLEDWSPRFPGFYLYYPSRRQAPPALRAFIAFLRGGRASVTRARRTGS